MRCKKKNVYHYLTLDLNCILRKPSNCMLYSAFSRKTSTWEKLREHWTVFVWNLPRTLLFLENYTKTAMMVVVMESPRQHTCISVHSQLWHSWVHVRASDYLIIAAIMLKDLYAEIHIFMIKYPLFFTTIMGTILLF